jgi:hypothetical protein
MIENVCRKHAEMASRMAGLFSRLVEMERVLSGGLCGQENIRQM